MLILRLIFGHFKKIDFSCRKFIIIADLSGAFNDREIADFYFGNFAGTAF